MFFPATLILWLAGPEGAKELSGENVLRLIQLRLTVLILAKITQTSQGNSQWLETPIQAPKTQSAFIGTHDEPLSLAVRVNNPDCAPVIVEGLRPSRR